MAKAMTNGHAADSTLTHIGGQIKTLQADIAALSALVGEVAVTKTAEAHESAKETAAETAQTVQAAAIKAGTEARQTAEQAYAKTEATVRENPAMAVGIAAGIGFLAGFALTRKS